MPDTSILPLDTRGIVARGTAVSACDLAVRITVSEGLVLGSDLERVHRRLDFVPKPPCAISQDFTLPCGAVWIPGLRAIGRYAADQIQKHGSGMLVGGNRITKRDVAEVTAGHLKVR